jgi:ribosomal protein S18 acetylase RimI-like enzyme
MERGSMIVAAAGDETAALREMAANRGCRLVRSRRRKPGGDFGRYGLTDSKSGKEIFGFGKAGLEASAEEIADFLRKRTLSTWESSLGAVAKTRAAPSSAKSKPAKASPAPGRIRSAAKPARPIERQREAPAAPRREAPAPAPPPPLRIRVADAVDGEAIAALLADLGFAAGPDEVSDRIGRLSRTGEPVLVAKLGDSVAGCLAWHIMTVLHRPRPVGRITLLIVAEKHRRKGVGRALIEAAEARLIQRGCGLLEAASDPKARAAQAFYERLGYEATGRLFTKPLAAKSA